MKSHLQLSTRKFLILCTLFNFVSLCYLPSRHRYLCRRGKKIVRPRVMDNSKEMFSQHERIDALVNAKILWSHSQGLHRSKPNKIPAPRGWRGNELLPLTKKFSGINISLQSKSYLSSMARHWAYQPHMDSMFVVYIFVFLSWCGVFAWLFVCFNFRFFFFWFGKGREGRRGGRERGTWSWVCRKAWRL